MDDPKLFYDKEDMEHENSRHFWAGMLAGLGSALVFWAFYTYAPW